MSGGKSTFDQLAGASGGIGWEPVGMPRIFGNAPGSVATAATWIGKTCIGQRLMGFLNGVYLTIPRNGSFHSLICFLTIKCEGFSQMFRRNPKDLQLDRFDAWCCSIPDEKCHMTSMHWSHHSLCCFFVDSLYIHPSSTSRECKLGSTMPNI